MERSNQPPKPECGRGEGQASAAKAGGGAEQLIGSVHREIHGPQAGVAPRLSNSASKHSEAGGDGVLQPEPKTKSASKGEALADLPGSKSVAREEQAVRNLGDPENSRRTNYEGQAGRAAQRQEEQAEGKLGVGSLHSSSGQSLQDGTDVGEGGDSSTRLAEETSAVRMTEQRWPTDLRAIIARVELKSPVREYCTPGSVRGALGNQRPYLDNGSRNLRTLLNRRSR